ncbi:MAG: hypothetical protein J6Y28_01485 [Acholeplasmatales bacterium]|nr:hypothetical protein [Acholeplasmatales bacterium]
MLKRYSIPVLTSEENSAYRDNYKFDISIVDQRTTKEFAVISVKVDMNSETLNNYLNSLSAKIGLRISTNLHTFFNEYSGISEDLEVKIPVTQLERIDKIKIVGYILTSKKVIYDWNEELKEIYEQSYKFELLPNEILGESNEEITNYREAGSSFISICKASDQSNKGLLFSIAKENMIQVKVGDEYNESFNKLQSEEKKVCVKDIMNSFLAFNSILYAINKMVMEDEPIDKYSKNVWFKALDYNFDDPKYDDFESFITAMQDKCDVDEIMRIAQAIMNNQLELKTIDTWRRIR